MPSQLRPRLAVVSLAGVAALGLAAPAAAQDSQPGNPGQGSERCEAAGAPGRGGYPPAQGTQSAAVSDSSPQRGQRVTATSGCREFAPGQRVTTGVESVFQQLDTVLASAFGEAVTTFTVPTNLPDGQHHVVFRGTGFTGGTNVVRIPITVAGGPATGDAAVGDVEDAAAAEAQTVVVAGVSLPRTGSDEVVPLTAAGIGLVAAGAGLVLVARRRRQGALPTP